MAPTNPPASAVDITTAAGVASALKTGTTTLYAYTDSGTLQAPGLTLSAVRDAVIADFLNTLTKLYVPTLDGIPYYNTASGTAVPAGTIPRETQLLGGSNTAEATEPTNMRFYLIVGGTYHGKYVRRDDVMVVGASNSRKMR